MKAIGYIRVSTQGQVEDGVSLDAQEAKVRSWAVKAVYDIV
jgi:site-specific DNA recombinase